MSSSRRAFLSATAGGALLAAISGPAEATAPVLTSRPRSATGTGALIGPTVGPCLHVMSLNVRLARGSTAPGDPDHWPDRIPVVQALLRREQPDLLGTQEVLHQQIAPIRAALPAHFAMLGEGRNGGTKGEYSAIFYNARRFQVTKSGQFWISKTPRVSSVTPGGKFPRIVVWARMVDRRTTKPFLWINTHFDHLSEESRRLGARQIVELRAAFPRVPAIVTGDFNSAALSSPAWDLMVGSGEFRDTWLTAKHQVTPAYGTFGGYRAPKIGGGRIDWVLADRGRRWDIRVIKAAINDFSVNGRYPSDHLPVQAKVRLI